MSYGDQSNGPWQRNVLPGQMFMQDGQQSNMASFGYGGMQGVNSGNMYPGVGGGGNSVAYPQHRSGLNPVAFQQGGSGQPSYNSIGTVTKLGNDCGLINHEIFFYRNVCKGREPILGDRVIFEATHTNNGQFKWNATRVQLMQQTPPGYVTVAPPSNEYKRAQMRRNSPKRSPIRARHDRDRERLHRSRDRDQQEEQERKKRRTDHEHGVDSKIRGAAEARGGHATRNEKERDRVEPKRKEREGTGREREDRGRDKELTSESEINRAGPKDRRARNRKRYMVKVPKSLLAIKSADIQDLRRRYDALYIPSDFFLTNVKWPDTFTPENPYSLRRPCHFHIMNELVESPVEQNSDLLEPPDANYLYSAKVMLMSLPPISEIYEKCFESYYNENHHPVHLSRLINFLVGVKGGVGSMAIGGPWSQSLDGENPDKDPSVLIRTAIRNCKALTGIDLSNCTQWYRFVELYYHRTEYKNMEKDGPPRVETVVIYLPDVHSCMPSIEEWQTLTQLYKNAADGIITRRSELVAANAANTNDDNDKSNDVEMADGDAEEDTKETSTDNNDKTAENNEEVEKTINEDEQKEENMEDSTVSVDLTGADDDDEAEYDSAEYKEEQPEDQATADDEEPAPEPTHYSLLDLKSMKVQDIREELLARSLPDTGVRNVVMARLAKALNSEKSEETKNKNKRKHYPNENNNKAKMHEEKMEIETSSKTSDKKATAEIKKKIEHKVDKEDNVKGKAKLAKSPNGEKNITKKDNETEDKEDWADIIDFELSDIVVLDEYDSSKNVEETNLKEMSEKEKARLIRHHTLPPSPQIIVHPNRQAKGGKFDCAIKSLSVLLDYHPDDSKERFFEVSLFAELFNDMLMRDFGFNIYKEIYLYEETASADSNTEVNETKTGGATNAENSEIADEIEKESKEKPNEKEKSATDLQSVKSETRKRKLSTSNSTANGKDNELSTSNKNMVVVKPQLLLSFTYFDTTHCGYIFEQDLEDLFTVLGLNLSRSQIKKLLGMCKLSKYQAIYYRKLTDKEESLVDTPAIEDIDNLPADELKRIAAGNNQYECVFAGNKFDNQLSANEDNDVSNEGLINFNGTMVHVGKLLNQINRSEKHYSDLQKIYNDLQQQHADLQRDHNKSTTKMKELQAEIKSVSRKLTDANQDFYSLNRKYRDQHSTLSYIYTRVEPYFSREKDKDKDTKSEGARDKERNEKEKEKEKENEKSKDKECEKEKENPKDEKEMEIKKEDNKTKESSKDDNAKEQDKDDKGNEKNKIKDDKVKDTLKVKDEKDKDKEKIKDEKVKIIEEKGKEKEKVNSEKGKEKVKDEKDNKEKDKIKDEKNKDTEKVKDEKDKVKDNKGKEPVKNDKEKEKSQPVIRPKPKMIENKEKPATKDNKVVKATVQKNVIEKPKPATPGVKKPSDLKPVVRLLKKSLNVGPKK